MRLETERLVLRSLRPEDVEPEVRLWADPEVTRYLGGPRDRDKVRRLLEGELEAPPAGPLGQWPVADRITGEVVGDCGLISKEIDGGGEIELVYVFSQDVWGRGYATEIGLALLAFAAQALGEGRVVSLIDPDNLASKRVATKLGMVREAVVTRPDGGERELWVTGAVGA